MQALHTAECIAILPSSRSPPLEVSERVSARALPSEAAICWSCTKPGCDDEVEGEEKRMRWVGSRATTKLLNFNKNFAIPRFSYCYNPSRAFGFRVTLQLVLPLVLTTVRNGEAMLHNKVFNLQKKLVWEDCFRVDGGFVRKWRHSDFILKPRFTNSKSSYRSPLISSQLKLKIEISTTFTLEICMNQKLRSWI